MDLFFSGLCLTGKSAVEQIAEMLARARYSKHHIFSSGNRFRELTGMQSKTGEVDKAKVATPDIDYLVDKEAQEFVNRHSPFAIVEGRLAATLLQAPMPIRILYTCDNPVRIKRYLKRSLGRMPTEEEVQQLGAEAEQNILARDKFDLERFKQTYRRDDIFNPENYDIVMNTSDFTLDQQVQKTHELIALLYGRMTMAA